MTKVFVYGTLMRGCRLHHHMSLVAADYLGDFLLPKSEGFVMRSVRGMYPMLCQARKGEEPQEIRGELYEVCDEGLSHLDDVEGVDCGLYKRYHTAGDFVVYVGDKHIDASFPRVECADWKTYCWTNPKETEWPGLE